jgi:hypothetical protein
MKASIKILKKEVNKLERKTNDYINALRELQEQIKVAAINATAGKKGALYKLKTLQIKCKLIHTRYDEKSILILKLNDKINMLEQNGMTFTAEDVLGFEQALNESEGKELKIDKLNPLFSNVKFLRVLRSQLETHEIYEKCALLQKRIELLKVG